MSIISYLPAKKVKLFFEKCKKKSSIILGNIGISYHFFPMTTSGRISNQIVLYISEPLNESSTHYLQFFYSSSQEQIRLTEIYGFTQFSADISVN